MRPVVLAALLVAVGGGVTACSGGKAPAPATTASSSVATTVVREKTAVVPSLVGLREAAARDRARALGFEPLVRTGASTRPRGLVVSQNPAAGVRLPLGAAVGLVVSAARPARTVPAVVGLPVAVAVAKLREAGYRSRTRQIASQRRAGRVDAQSPTAGTKQAGGEVLLTVSLGPRRVTVPSVVGLPLAVAARELRGLGFAAAVRAQASQQPAGTVIAQAPQHGAVLPQGSTVRLTMATGSGTRASLTVPNVQGRSRADAQSILRAVRLTPHVKRVRSLEPVGTVVAQSPRAGTKAGLGERVTLSISSGPGP